MSKLIYNFFILLYHLGIKCFALINPKAKLWVDGRKSWQQHLQQKIKPNEKYIWVHCASLGEFEQGRPLIEAIGKEYPAYKILLTFFSPSGFEIRKNYGQADVVCYLPIDTVTNAIQFLAIVKPQLVVFVKYEFWLNYLAELKQQKIPTVLISAIFRPGQIFFKWYGKLFFTALKNYTTIFVQNKFSFDLLKQHGLTNVQIATDTRFDRVIATSLSVSVADEIKLFKNEKKIFIVGSSWQPDEDLVIQLIHQNKNTNWKFIIVPHEIGQPHIEELQKKNGATAVCFSELKMKTKEEIVSASILIVDTIGQLSSLYSMAEIAMVGGGFGKGIHNTLEAAVFGIPILIGPKHEKFHEAKDLVAQGGVLIIKTAADLQNAFTHFQNADERKKAGEINRNYVIQNTGGTKVIMESLSEHLN